MPNKLENRAATTRGVRRMGYHFGFGLILRSILSGTLILVILFGVDFETIGELFGSLRVSYFGIAVLFVVLDRFLMAYKWRLLIYLKGINISVWQSFRIYLISNFVGLLLPTGVGGDIYRIYHTARYNGHAEDITASVILERLVGVVASAIFAGIGLICMFVLYQQRLFDTRTVIIIVGLFGLSLLGFWISIQRSTLTFTERLLGRWRDHLFYKKLFKCYQAYLEYRQYKTVLIVFLLLSILEQSFYAVINYWGSKSINLDIGFLYFIGVIPICHILMRIPISINAIGVQEGLYVFFFSHLGLSVSEIFSLVLLVRVTNWMPRLVGGLLYLIGEDKSKVVIKTLSS
jgi:hypothetical protein